MNIVEIKKIAGRLKSSLFKNSNSYAIGMLKSHFKGTGLQFKEHQIYSHGDDVRFIDWKMIAKTNKPYIKTFEEERNVEIAVVIDATTTMMSGYEGVSKLQAAIEICCLLYILAKETGDYIHVTIIGEQISFVPKKSGDDGIVNFIAALQRADILDENGHINVQYVPDSELTHQQKIGAVMKHLLKRREIVMLSDFNDFFDFSVLKKLLYRSNVHCFQIVSPLDEADKIPYALHLKDSASSKKGSVRKVNLAGSSEPENPLGKKFKKLRVHERYLETFIKEML